MLRANPGGDCPDVANRPAPDANTGRDVICLAESQRDLCNAEPASPKLKRWAILRRSLRDRCMAPRRSAPVAVYASSLTP
jgi:hypothetical protein